MTASLEELLDGQDERMFDIDTSAAGPGGQLPLTDAMLDSIPLGLPSPPPGAGQDLVEIIDFGVPETRKLAKWMVLGCS